MHLLSIFALNFMLYGHFMTQSFDDMELTAGHDLTPPSESDFVLAPKLFFWSFKTLLGSGLKNIDELLSSLKHHPISIIELDLLL